MSFQTNFNTLVGAMRNFDHVKQVYKAEAERIHSNAMWSQEHKAKLVSKLQDDTLEKLSGLCDVVDAILPDIRLDTEQEEATGLNLADVRLVNAVALISAPGANQFPEATQAAIVAPFIKDHKALNVLFPILSQANMLFAKDKVTQELAKLNEASAFLDNVSDNAYYAALSVDPTWNMAASLTQAELFAEAHDLQMPNASDAGPMA